MVLIKKTGELALIKKTKDDNDVIYSGSFEKDGEFKKDGESIAVDKGALFGEKEQNLAEEGVIFRNLEDGLKVMKFLSFKGETEFSGWGFSDSSSDKGLFINPWSNNTYRSAKDLLLQTGERVGLLGSLGTKEFKIHTHPSKEKGYGYGYASPTDKRNVQYNPEYPHYILSKRQGITRYNQTNTYTVGDLNKYF